MTQYYHIENTLNLPLITYENFKHSSEKALALNKSEEIYGIVIPIINSTNPLQRIFQLIITKLKITLLKYQLMKKDFQVESQYGVYPDENNPVAIYELSTQAEKYTNLNILPQFNNNLNGKIRQSIMKLIKFHPSIGALILIIRKN